MTPIFSFTRGEEIKAEEALKAQEKQRQLYRNQSTKWFTLVDREILNTYLMDITSNKMLFYVVSKDFITKNDNTKMVIIKKVDRWYYPSFMLCSDCSSLKQLCHHIGSSVLLKLYLESFGLDLWNELSKQLLIENSFDFKDKRYVNAKT